MATNETPTLLDVRYPLEKPDCLYLDFSNEYHCIPVSFHQHGLAFAISCLWEKLRQVEGELIRLDCKEGK